MIEQQKYQHTIINLFTHFLKEKNVFPQFLHNANLFLNKKRSISIYQYMDRMINAHMGYDFIMSAFSWDDTLEGSDFWCNLHHQWCRQCINQGLGG